MSEDVDFEQRLMDWIDGFWEEIEELRIRSLRDKTGSGFATENEVLELSNMENK